MCTNLLAFNLWLIIKKLKKQEFPDTVLKQRSHQANKTLLKISVTVFQRSATSAGLITTRQMSSAR